MSCLDFRRSQHLSSLAPVSRWQRDHEGSRRNAIGMPPVSFKDSGGFGGVTEGINWQLGRSFLIGIETDFSGANIKGTGTASSNPGIFGFFVDLGTGDTLRLVN